MITNFLVLFCLFSDLTMGQLLLSATTPAPPAMQYAVVLDAAQTKTNVWVYCWPQQNASAAATTLPTITPCFSSSVSVPLSSYAGNSPPIDVSSLLQPAIALAKPYVPAAQQSQTPIYLYGAGAMRLLSQTVSSAIMSGVQWYLSNPSWNPFFFVAHNARILSGSEEESAFQWLSVNYATGYLTGVPGVQPSGILVQTASTTDIAFMPTISIYDNAVTYSLAGRIYTFYSHSYLNYGEANIGSIVQQYLSILSPSATLIQNPCMVKGTNSTSSGVVFNGTGDTVGCSTILQAIMYKPLANSPQCSPMPCAIGTVYQPPIPPTQTLYVLGDFYLSMGTLKLNLSAGNFAFNLDSMFNQTQSLCSMPLQGIQATLNQPANLAQYIPISCQALLFMKAVFSTGFGIPGSTTQLIAASNVVNNIVADFTLGALLVENSLMPPKVLTTPRNSASSQLRELNVIIIAIIMTVCFTLPPSGTTRP